LHTNSAVADEPRDDESRLNCYKQRWALPLSVINLR